MDTRLEVMGCVRNMCGDKIGKERALARKYMKERIFMTALASITAMTAVVPMQVYAADNNFDYRKKVIGLAGIINNVSTEMDAVVTRAQFARMLVNASSYKDYIPEYGNLAVYADVPAGYSEASYIRIAAEKNWMTGYLGGVFKPDQAVTLKEAARGILALLGYSSEDFTGGMTASRMSLFHALDLNDEMNLQDNEVLTKRACVNLFYNLLKTEMKNSSKVYGTVIGCTVNSDGEINPMDMADVTLKGPKLVLKNSQLGDYVPFNVQQASVYVNGEASSYDLLKSIISSNHVVIYYNQQAKTIWAYVVDEDVQNGRCAVRGTIEAIYYSSADVMTPTSILLEGDSEEYKLNSSEMQFAFSIYGSLRVGDSVTLICEKSTNSNDDASYTVVDYIED